MRIVVNGESRDVGEGLTVADLLGLMSLPEKRVAVELNRRLVPRSRHAQTPLADRDELEIMTLVGGG